MLNLKSGVNVDLARHLSTKKETGVNCGLALYPSCRLLKAGVIGSRYNSYVEFKIGSNWFDTTMTYVD